MKSKIFIAFVLIIIFSCQKETQNACKSSNPIDDVTWIKAIKNSLTNCTCEISIIEGTYDNKTIFYTQLTDPVCNGIFSATLFDCNGKVVRIFKQSDYDDFFNLVTRNKVLYRCKSKK